MAATALLKTLLLFLSVWRGGAVCTYSYTAYPGMTVSGVRTYISNVGIDGAYPCQSRCSDVDSCYGYIFDSSRPDDTQCTHILSYFEPSMIYGTGQRSITLYRRDCPISTRPPFRTSTTTTRRPPPRTRPPATRGPPPSTGCPSADGLSTGMVVLIAVFTAIGGIILGMFFAAKCCHIGHGGSWLGGGNHPPNCSCQECKPVHGSDSCKDPSCTSCHKPAPVPHSCHTTGCTSPHQVAPPSCITCHIPGCTGCHPHQHPHLLKHGPVFPALPAPGPVTPGQTFSVAASPYNDVYTVSLPGN